MSRDVALAIVSVSAMGPDLHVLLVGAPWGGHRARAARRHQTISRQSNRAKLRLRTAELECLTCGRALLAPSYEGSGSEPGTNLGCRCRMEWRGKRSATLAGRQAKGGGWPLNAALIRDDAFVETHRRHG